MDGKVSAFKSEFISFIPGNRDLLILASLVKSNGAKKPVLK